MAAKLADEADAVAGRVVDRVDGPDAASRDSEPESSPIE